MQTALRITTVTIIALLIPLIPFLVVGELPGERWLSRADDNALLFSTVGSGLLALDVVLPIPSSIVGTELGIRLGFWVGSSWCWFGLMVGNMVGYVLGYLVPARFATSLPSEPTGALLFLSRPVPVFAEAATLAAGACRFPLRTFFVSCALGNAIYAIALCANGALWLHGDWRLVFPMLLPVLAWLAWRRLGPQARLPI